MGVSNGDGDGGEVDGDDSGGNSPSGRVPEQRRLSPELGFAMTAATELFFHGKVTPRNFLGQRLHIGEEATRGGARSGQT